MDEMMVVAEATASATVTATTYAVENLAAELRSGMSGQVILPGEPEYDRARRVWNGNYDRRPLLVVRPANTADVAFAVKVARRNEIPLTVKSGGHSMDGLGVGENAVLVDLSCMKGLTIDAERRIARAQTGLTAGEYTQAAAQYGLATPFGDTASVGLGGITLGGGIGWLTRKYGLTIDNLLSVELVDGEGEVVRASAEENPDLFWALRGGGGNFGIATEFEYRLHAVGMVYGGAVIYPLAEARQVVAGWMQYGIEAPEGLTTIGNIMPAPPAPFIPAEWHGVPVIVIMACFTGDLAEGAGAVEPLPRLGTPIVDMLGPMPYPAMYHFTDEAGKPGSLGHIRSMFVEKMDREMIEGVMARYEGVRGVTDVFQIRPLGGAMSRVPSGETAYPHRTQPFMLAVIADAPDRASAAVQTAWAEDMYEFLRPYEAGVYVNFLANEGEERLREAYAGNYARLAELKQRYDPDNFFWSNRNIKV